MRKLSKAQPIGSKFDERRKQMTTQRFAIYRAVHKAIRHVLFATSQKVGMTDFADDADVQEALEAVDKMLSLLHIHREHEDQYVHPPAESRVPGITANFEADHLEDIALSTEVGEISGKTREANGEERVALGIRLHERLNAYIGIYLGHLYREETVMQQALWDNFTDEEIIAIDMAIVANIPPPMMAEFIPLMCSTFSPAEITPILADVKANAPAEFAQSVLKSAEENLPPRSWSKVKASLG